MAISIDFFANVREFLRGTKDVEGALEDVSSSLDDVVRDSDKAGDKIGDNLTDGTKEAEKGVDRLERTFKELADTAKRETKTAGDSIGRDYRKGTDEAGEGLKDFKQEANQTAKESAASFDGSAESIVDVFQEVAANAFAGFGPAGAVAGLAAAVGIGFAVSAIEGATEGTEAFKERVGELSQQFIEAGGVGTRSFDDLVDNVKSLASETDSSKDQLSDLKKVADELELPLKDVVSAYLSGGPALDKLINKNKDLQKAEQQRYAESVDANNVYSAATDGINTTLNDQLTLLKGQKEAIELAQQAELDYLQSGATEFEVKKGLIEAIDGAYDDARSAVSDFWNTETNSFDLTGWMGYVEEHKGLVLQFQENLALMEMTPEQWANFLELPESAQQSIASSWAAGDSALRSQIATTLTDGAGTAGADAAVAFDTAFTPKTDIDVKVTTDPKPAESAIAAVAGAKYTADIKVTSSNKAATKTAIDNVALPRTARIAASVDTSAAESALNAFTSRYRSSTIVVKMVGRNGKEVI